MTRRLLSPIYTALVITLAMSYPYTVNADVCQGLIKHYGMVKVEIRDLQYLVDTKMLSAEKLESVLKRIEDLKEARLAILTTHHGMCNVRRN